MSKATIVPGVHDLIPPDGRITLELLHPDTGRVRKRVRAENTIMDWYRKNASMNGGRGSAVPVAGTNSATSFNPLEPAAQFNKPWPWYMNKPYGWPTGVTPNVTQNWLWATDQNVAPDETKLFIPTNNQSGDVTSGVRLDASWSPDSIQFKRGGITLASCLRSWDRTRIVTEFGLAYGNGTYRSIGVGSLVNQRNNVGMRSTPASVASAVNGSYTNGSIGIPVAINGSGVTYFSRGCIDYEDGGLWGWKTLSGFNDGLYWQSAESISDAVRLVTTANHPGSGGQISYGVNGSDFWVGRNQTLYRCVKPVADVAMTVTDTYDLSGTLGAQTILDIAVNRVANKVYLLTSTHVHVIDGATGAPESNFAHGITAIASQPTYAAIEWSPAEALLFISPGSGAAGGVDSGWGQATSPSNLAAEQHLLVPGFTTAGVAGKGLMLSQYGHVNTNAILYSGLCMLNDWGISQQSRVVTNAQLYLYGPSMATHALLPSDVVKTSADALRITYDFDFV